MTKKKVETITKVEKEDTKLINTVQEGEINNEEVIEKKKELLNEDIRFPFIVFNCGNGSVNLRETPSFIGKIIGSISRDTVVFATSYPVSVEEGFIEIITESGLIGFMSDAYLKPANEE